MSDSEPEQTKPGRAAPGVAFDRAMAGIDTRCSHMATLLEIGDLQRIAHVSRSAVNLWLTGRSAYRRLVEGGRSATPHATAAPRRLDAAYLVLLQLLKRAHAQAPDHATRSWLDDAQADLITVAAQPISDAALPAGAEHADDTQDMDIDD